MKWFLSRDGEYWFNERSGEASIVAIMKPHISNNYLYRLFDKKSTRANWKLMGVADLKNKHDAFDMAERRYRELTGGLL